MNYIYSYESLIGKINLISDGEVLTGLYFNTNNEIKSIDKFIYIDERNLLPIFAQTRKWLDIYFSGREPEFTPPLKLIGTPFRLSVWNILQKIPYGTTVTYGDIAKILAKQRNIAKMSAQAVGGAVGANPIPIIVPCHRVIGINNNLVGYAGGIDKKIKLLALEHIDVQKMRMPKK